MITRKLTSARTAAELLKEGKLVAFPTETVFGLGADATNSAAIAQIFEAKGRPSDNPLIVHLADVGDWSLAARELTDCGRVLLEAFSPGPLTVVLPKRNEIVSQCTAGLDSVAIRVPACTITRAMLSQAGIPVAAPSANRSGRPSCTSWQSVLEDLEGRIDAVLCHNTEAVGLESTVVDCRHVPPVILRPGAITLEDIHRYFPAAVSVLASQTRSPSAHSNSDACASADASGATSPLQHSPGTSHPHYRPQAKVWLFSRTDELQRLSGASPERFAACTVGTFAPDIEAVLRRLGHWKHFRGVTEYAAGFYEFLREADRLKPDGILIQLVEDVGLGHALRERQLRAAGRR